MVLHGLFWSCWPFSFRLFVFRSEGNGGDTAGGERGRGGGEEGWREAWAWEGWRRGSFGDKARARPLRRNKGRVEARAFWGQEEEEEEGRVDPPLAGRLRKVEVTGAASLEAYPSDLAKNVSKGFSPKKSPKNVLEPCRY